MKSKYFIYSAIFDDEKYKKIDNAHKYTLAMIYSHMDLSNNVLKISKEDFFNIANTTYEAFKATRRLLREYDLMEEVKHYYRFEFIIKTPKNTEKVYIPEELITGKYRHLGKGTKLFYSYFLKRQIQQGQDYIDYTIADLMKPFAGSHKTTNKYCKELVEAGLLDQVAKSKSYKYHFKKI